MFVCVDSGHQRGDGGQQGEEICQRRLTAVVPDEDSWVRKGEREKLREKESERGRKTERGTE